MPRHLRDDCRYGVFRFPFGKMFLAGDDRLLRMAAFGDTSEAAMIMKNMKKGSARMVDQSLDFLAAYMERTGLPLPSMDLGVYTEKQQSVYRELMQVGFGRTVSYGELAARSGMPRAGRFVGSAMAKNNFPVFIPCHRVIKADGRPGNYSSGVEKKIYLLTHEGVLRNSY